MSMQSHWVLVCVCSLSRDQTKKDQLAADDKEEDVGNEFDSLINAHLRTVLKGVPKTLAEAWGSVPPQALIKESIIEELTYFNDHVWEACAKKEMMDRIRTH